jgi:hypothetical protein
VACKSIKEPVDTFRIEVFVVMASKLSIDPVIDCKVSIDPMVASKSRIVATEALRLEVFVIDD